MLPGLPHPNPGDINPELWIRNFEAIGADGFPYFTQLLTRRQTVRDLGPDPCDRPRAGSRFNARQRSQMYEVALRSVAERRSGVCCCGQNKASTYTGSERDFLTKYFHSASGNRVYRYATVRNNHVKLPEWQSVAGAGGQFLSGWFAKRPHAGSNQRQQEPL